MSTTFTVEQFVALAPRGLVVRCGSRTLFYSRTLSDEDLEDVDLLEHSLSFLADYVDPEASYHYMVRYDGDTPSTMYDSWDIFRSGYEVEVVSLPNTTIYRRHS